MSILMEPKTKKNVKKTKGLLNFISELKEELKKVTWTTRSELLSSTKIVILSIFGFGIGIYLVDLLIKGVLESVKRIAYFIFG